MTHLISFKFWKKTKNLCGNIYIENKNFIFKAISKPNWNNTSIVTAIEVMTHHNKDK